MVKIGVIHSSLNRSLGGAEKLCVETIRALKEAGYFVDLIVNSKTDPRIVKTIFGVATYPDKEIVVQPSVQIPTIIYSRFVHWLFRDVFYASRLRRNYDLTINTKPLLPIAFTDVMYMHFFSFPGSLEVYYKKYQNTMMKIYKFPYEVLIKLCAEVFNSLQSKPVVLTNSQFSKQVIMKYLDVVPFVIYPPVDVEKYLALGEGKERKNIILTISRIEEGKGLDIIPELAERVSNAKFVIIGTLSSDHYLRYLRKMIKNMGVARRVKIIPNASETVKRAFLSKSKIFFHPMKYEHFGIAIVEAMAAGLVPLVSRTGGPWIDILNRKQGLYGFAYEDVDSCISYVDELLNDDNLRKSMVKRAVERSRRFTSENFRNHIVYIAKECISRKVSYNKC